jgi:Domain of unknown function (DUF4328)
MCFWNVLCALKKSPYFHEMILLPDNSKRAKNVLVSFYVLFCIQILVLVSGFLQYLLLLQYKAGDFNQADAATNDLRQRIILITHLLMFIVCIVLFILWSRRAYNNLNLSGKASTKYAEGWAAGAWFVPFLNLGRPYLIIQEIWEKTQDATEGLLNYYRSNIVGWWWASWIFYNVATNLTTNIFKGNSIDDLYNATIADFICNVFELGALVLIIIIVKRIAEFEKNLQQSLLNEIDNEGEDKLNLIIG